MPLSVLQLFVLFFIVLVVHGDVTTDSENHLLSENKAVYSEDNIKHHSLDHLDPAGTLAQRTFLHTRPTTSTTVFQPTPTTVILSTPNTAATPGPGATAAPPISARPPPLFPPANSATVEAPIASTTTVVTNPTIVALPQPATTSPDTVDPVCGRKGFCYQWFDDEVDLNRDGYQRCNILEDRVARFYCCTP